MSPSSSRADQNGTRARRHTAGGTPQPSDGLDELRANVIDLSSWLTLRVFHQRTLIASYDGPGRRRRTATGSGHTRLWQSHIMIHCTCRALALGRSRERGQPTRRQQAQRAEEAEVAATAAPARDAPTIHEAVVVKLYRAPLTG
eukprot:7217223-Prymnesium_polylepis.1